MAFAKQSFQDRLDAQTKDMERGKTYLVGVTIFRPSPDPESTTKFQLLILTRAEHEEAFPNNWELLGGHLEPNETFRQCVERETMEGTGLVFDKVLGEFAELLRDSKSSGKKNVQMNYAVSDQEPMEVRLNPEEHSEWMWANEDAVDTLFITPAMKTVLPDSFETSNTNSIF